MRYFILALYSWYYVYATTTRLQRAERVAPFVLFYSCICDSSVHVISVLSWSISLISILIFWVLTEIVSFVFSNGSCWYFNIKPTAICCHFAKKLENDNRSWSNAHFSRDDTYSNHERNIFKPKYFHFLMILCQWKKVSLKIIEILELQVIWNCNSQMQTEIHS